MKISQAEKYLSGFSPFMLKQWAMAICALSLTSMLSVSISDPSPIILPFQLMLLIAACMGWVVSAHSLTVAFTKAKGDSQSFTELDAEIVVAFKGRGDLQEENRLLKRMRDQAMHVDTTIGDPVVVCVGGKAVKGVCLDKTSAYIPSTGAIQLNVSHMWPLGLIEEADVYFNTDTLEEKIEKAAQESACNGVRHG